MTAALTALADPGRWPQLAAAVRQWLPSQRWFQGKARDLTHVEVSDAALLPGPPAVLLAVVTTSYSDGAPERYQVPLVDGDGPGLLDDVDGVRLRDALADDGAAHALARATLSERTAASVTGATIRGEPVGEGTVALPEHARPLGVEQSNSSVVFGDDLLLKVFRKLERGLNPDVELTRALTAHGFDHVPPQVGALLLDDTAGVSALAVLSVFRAASWEGWDLACAEAATARSGGDPARLAGGAEDLGAVVGRMHLILRDAFGQRRATRDDLVRWSRTMHEQARDVLATARRRAHTELAEVLSHEQALLAAFDGLENASDGGALVRTHGDLHLGQVLYDERHGWQLLDFEGEPARPLAERREPHSPLRDVAGMLRSFDYAAAHGAPRADAHAAPEVATWRDDLRAAFLRGYHDTCGGAGLLPTHERDAERLRVAFELDKAVYELGYELANRPTWVGIPAAGIRRLLSTTSTISDH